MKASPYGSANDERGTGLELQGKAHGWTLSLALTANPAMSVPLQRLSSSQRGL